MFENLKLIYVLKIGYNSKGEGLYEFIFSNDITNIDVEGWLWDVEPASDNAQPPEEEYVDDIYHLQTSSFDLFCLHEAVDRPYMHGYHNIHALAYEVEKENLDGYSQYEDMFENSEDIPLLVFHYGMSFNKVKELMYERKVILRDHHFIESSKSDLS